MIKYGKKIIQKQIIQRRLADCAIDLYAMIAAISRTDHCIKTKSEAQCKRQILYCNTFCEQAWRRIRRNLLMIDKNNDDELLAIAEQVIEDGEYKI